MCRLFHSTTSFVCPAQLKSYADTPESNPNMITVGVIQERMNYTISTDPEKFTMRIGAGMKLREFTAEATRVGMSVQVGSLPAYAGLTMAGVMSTSGHGSGDNATSNICDTLISVTWVDASGKVRSSKRDSEEGKLFCGGMGLIGIITGKSGTRKG
jgi:FAD/FMN-containing dehydrogenase